MFAMKLIKYFRHEAKTTEKNVTFPPSPTSTVWSAASATVVDAIKQLPYLAELKFYK